VTASDRATLVSRMLGRSTADIQQGRTRLAARTSTADRSAEPALQADALSRKLVIDDISLSVAPGEVVGLAGLLGSGRSETAKAIFGALPTDSGSVTVAGKRLKGG